MPGQAIERGGAYTGKVWVDETGKVLITTADGDTGAGCGCGCCYLVAFLLDGESLDYDVCGKYRVDGGPWIDAAPPGHSIGAAGGFIIILQGNAGTKTVEFYWFIVGGPTSDPITTAIAIYENNGGAPSGCVWCVNGSVKTDSDVITTTVYRNPDVATFAADVPPADGLATSITVTPGTCS